MTKIVRFGLIFAIAIAATAIPAFAGTAINVPEPASLVLLASGIGGVAVLRRLRKR